MRSRVGLQSIGMSRSRMTRLADTSVVLHIVWNLFGLVNHGRIEAKVAKLAPDAKKTAARLDTWRGFSTKYGVNSRPLLFQEI
jgi:hypothetical protein